MSAKYVKVHIGTRSGSIGVSFLSSGAAFAVAKAFAAEVLAVAGMESAAAVGSVETGVDMALAEVVVEGDKASGVAVAGNTQRLEVAAVEHMVAFALEAAAGNSAVDTHPSLALHQCNSSPFHRY